MEATVKPGQRLSVSQFNAPSSCADGQTLYQRNLYKAPLEGHLSAMQSENPIISDFVKMANSAAGTLAGMTREARESARERMKEAMGGMDFVTREEFDTVKMMATKAREENAALEARIAALEAQTSGK